jgi:hypothetical protein
VEFRARVRNNAYIALGFGETMENTDMVIWQANGLNSLQQQLYSMTQGIKPQVVGNEWQTVFVYNETTGFVDFTSRRPLKANFGYELQLNIPFMICYAWNFETHELVYHGENNHATKEVLLHGEVYHGTLTDDVDVSYTHPTVPVENQVEGEADDDVIFEPRKGQVKYEPFWKKINNKWKENSHIVYMAPDWMHGAMMWVAWTFCGLLQVVSARYMGVEYKYRVQVHQMSGGLCVMLTLFSAWFIYLKAGLEFKWHYHSIFGLITISQALIVFALGYTAAYFRYSFTEWNVNLVK